MLHFLAPTGHTQLYMADYWWYCTCADFGPEWKQLYDSPSPQEAKLPEPWEIKLKGLNR